MVRFFALRCPVCGYEEVVEKLIYSTKICRNCKTPLEQVPFKIKCLHSERISLSNGKTLCRLCRKVFDQDGREVNLDTAADKETTLKKNTRALG